MQSIGSPSAYRLRFIPEYDGVAEGRPLIAAACWMETGRCEL